MDLILLPNKALYGYHAPFLMINNNCLLTGVIEHRSHC